jgi:hypothetical protein
MGETPSDQNGRVSRFRKEKPDVPVRTRRLVMKRGVRV